MNDPRRAASRVAGDGPAPDDHVQDCAHQPRSPVIPQRFPSNPSRPEPALHCESSACLNPALRLFERNQRNGKTVGC
jgi:hypothetical protein